MSADVSRQPGKPPRLLAEALRRLPLDRALATVVLPVHLNWSTPGRQFDLRDRARETSVLPGHRSSRKPDKRYPKQLEIEAEGAID